MHAYVCTCVTDTHTHTYRHTYVYVANNEIVIVLTCVCALFPASATAPDKLHPSWEASKKRRAEQSGITAFQGSKLTFDDDDD